MKPKRPENPYFSAGSAEQGGKGFSVSQAQQRVFVYLLGRKEKKNGMANSRNY